MRILFEFNCKKHSKKQTAFRSRRAPGGVVLKVANRAFSKIARMSFHRVVPAGTCRVDVRAIRSRTERPQTVIPDVEYLLYEVLRS